MTRQAGETQFQFGIRLKSESDPEYVRKNPNSLDRYVEQVLAEARNWYPDDVAEQDRHIEDRLG